MTYQEKKEYLIVVRRYAWHKKGGFLWKHDPFHKGHFKKIKLTNLNEVTYHDERGRIYMRRRLVWDEVEKDLFR